MDPLQDTFRALADPTRRGILALLCDGEKTIQEVADRFDMTRAAVRKHMHVLEQGRLISVRPRGRERISRLEADALRPVIDWLEVFSHFWDERLAALKQAVEADGSHLAKPRSDNERED